MNGLITVQSMESSNEPFHKTRTLVWLCFGSAAILSRCQNRGAHRCVSSITVLCLYWEWAIALYSPSIQCRPVMLLRQNKLKIVGATICKNYINKVDLDMTGMFCMGVLHKHTPVLHLFLYIEELFNCGDLLDGFNIVVIPVHYHATMTWNTIYLCSSGDHYNYLLWFVK